LVHFETPHHPPSGVMEFLRQYAMIVLSILTALALERAAVSISQRAAAAASKTRIEAELARDAGQLRKSLQSNADNLAAIKSSLKTLLEQLKSNPGDAARITALTKQLAGKLNVDMPPWQREAWDSAVADQSVSHMDPADLRRYAEIYTDEQDNNNEAMLLLGGEWLTRLSDLDVEFALGQVDGRGLAEALVRFQTAVSQIVASQQSLLALTDNRARN
jgi:precorrin-6x reductase